MSKTRKLVALLVAAVAAVGVVAVGVSSGSPAAGTSVVSAINTPVTGAGVAAREAFARTAGAGSDATTPAGHADLTKAVPAPIAGSSAQAWIAPEGESICLFVPSPTGNYGSSCFSAASIQAGDAMVITAKADGDESGTVTVAQIVADGKSGPSVSGPDQAASTLAVQSNVAASVLPASDTVTTGMGSIDLSSFIQKPKFAQP